MEEVTIGVVNFNGMETLPATLQSIQDLKYPAFKVLIVDNHSTDGSREWVQQCFPQFHCICLDSNIGLPGAHNVILHTAQTDYVFILDNDMVLEPDVLTRLVQAMKSVAGAAACHPEIRDLTDPKLASHYNGGGIHYLCALVPRLDNAGERPEYEIFDVVSGGALLIDRKAALHVGGFDEDFFFNWEDGDCTSRLTLAGYVCLNVPRAVVYHRGKQRGTAKIFYQVRNRWFFIVKLYSWKTLLLAAPIFLFFELSQMLFISMKGGAKDYWRGNFAALCKLPNILKKRRAFQKLKIKKDGEWLKSGDLYIPDELLKGRTLRILKRVYCNFFDIYWRAIRPFC